MLALFKGSISPIFIISIKRILDVNCSCNGENCKINSAALISGSGWKSALLVMIQVIIVFALQLLPLTRGSASAPPDRQDDLTPHSDYIVF